MQHRAQHLDEPADVGVVERRVDLVEQAEGARFVLEEPEHQRDGRQGLLAAREQLDALEPLAWRLRDDFDAALERIVLVEERQAGAAAAEQRVEALLEVQVDGGEGSEKRWRVVSSMRLMAVLVCAMESTRSLRCVVRNA